MTTRERGGRRDRGDRGESQSGGFQEKVVNIKRVAKDVKGGRHFSFNAMVVVGEGMGTVGIGLGKAGEVPDAVRKGTAIARKNMIKISMKGSTIPHPVTFSYGASRVMLRPAMPGTGVIAGGSVRAVVTAVGIKDILTKSLGSSNPINLVKATYHGLESMREPAVAVAERKALALALLASPPPEPRSPRPPRPNRPAGRPKDSRSDGPSAPRAEASGARGPAAAPAPAAQAPAVPVPAGPPVEPSNG